MLKVLRPLSDIGTGWLISKNNCSIIEFIEFKICGIIMELEANSILDMMSVSIVHICNQLCVKFIDLWVIYF